MKGPKVSAGNVGKLEGRPLSMYLVPGLVVAAATLLILAVLAHQVLSQGADGQAERTMSRASTLVSAALSADIQAKVDRLSFLASEPGLAAWVARGMDAKDRQVEVARLASWLPGVYEVRLLPAGWNQVDPVDQDLRAPLGYAGLDMLRRVVDTGKPVPAEIHQADIGKPYVALAVPLWNGDKAVGALLAAYPVAGIASLLESFEPLPGVMHLRQIAGDGQYTLAKIGEARAVIGNLRNVHVTGTIWELEYGASPQLAFGLELVSFLGFVALGMVPLALIFWLQLSTLARALRHDIEGIAEQAQAFADGRPAGVLRPRLQLTAKLQKQLGKLLRAARQSGPAAATGTAPAAVEEAGSAVAIPAEVFRAYDIRGDAERYLSDDFARRLGLALAGEVSKTGGNQAVVGRDVRLSSPRLARALTDGLTRGGCEVVDLGVAPTPLVYFARQGLRADLAVVVTASHNPAGDNGFKIALGDRVVAAEELAQLRNTMTGQLVAADSAGHRSERSFQADYCDRVASDVQLLRPFKVVVDAGNGAAGAAAVAMLRALGCDVIELFCDPDGSFPNHHPDPSQPDNLSALMLEVQAQEADIGLAFDGDGDRLGVVDNVGDLIWPDRVLMLLARDLLIRLPGSDILYDVKCSRHLGRFVLSQGGRPIMNASGHARMRARMQETGAPLGGEFSGHFFIAERWFGFDDALYAAARVLEVLSADNRPVSEQFAELPASPATPEYYLHLGEGESEAVMRALEQAANFEDAELVRVDGLRVEFSDGWGLVRPSNTTASLAFRFEADNDAALARVQDRLRDWLVRAAPGVTPPF